MDEDVTGRIEEIKQKFDELLGWNGRIPKMEAMLEEIRTAVVDTSGWGSGKSRLDDIQKSLEELRSMVGEMREKILKTSDPSFVEEIIRGLMK